LLKVNEHFCSNKGAGPFGGKIRTFVIKLQKSWTTGRNAVIFDMEHPWGKEIQVCLNE